MLTNSKIMVLQVLFLSFVSALLLWGNQVAGDIWKLSKQEDLELERQLKRLNKPAIKTIRTEYGDIYDCVDFYKQPAFDHPLLKNYTYDFEKETASNEPEDQEVLEFKNTFGLYIGEKCPHGTVMIKRLTKKDLIRSKLHSKLVRNRNIHYAGVRTQENDRPALYSGAGSRLGIYNPKALGRSYSAARMVLQAGLFDRISVGWRVDPFLTFDFRTHFYLRTDVGAGGGVHCFNIECPGFVHTSKVIPISWVFRNISRKGRPHYNFQVDIVRDSATGHWKLRVGPYDKIELGHWPKEIFSNPSGLSFLADSVEYGGEIYADPVRPSPPMGIGSLPTKSLSDSSFIAGLTYRNDMTEKLDASNLHVYADVPDQYNAIDLPDVDSWYKHVVFYGGPGGK